MSRVCKHDTIENVRRNTKLFDLSGTFLGYFAGGTCRLCYCDCTVVSLPACLARFIRLILTVLRVFHLTHISYRYAVLYDDAETLVSGHNAKVCNTQDQSMHFAYVTSLWAEGKTRSDQLLFYLKLTWNAQVCPDYWY